MTPRMSKLQDTPRKRDKEKCNKDKRREKAKIR